MSFVRHKIFITATKPELTYKLLLLSSGLSNDELLDAYGIKPEFTVHRCVGVNTLYIEAQTPSASEFKPFIEMVKEGFDVEIYSYCEDHVWTAKWENGTETFFAEDWENLEQARALIPDDVEDVFGIIEDLEWSADEA